MKKLIMIVIFLAFIGCSSAPKQGDGINNQKLENLLFTEGYFARKSVTIKDYKDDLDEC